MSWFQHIAHLTDQRNERYLPTAFDGSLSLVEKLNKAIEYLNVVIETTNTIGDYVDTNVVEQNLKIKNLRDEFEALKLWVENEGLQDRTTNVLNEWFDNGRLAEIINNDVFTNINDELQLKVGNGVLVGLHDLSQEVKTAMTGGSVAVVGTGSVNNTNINRKQITPDKITEILTINTTDLPLYAEGQYMNSTGTLITASDWNAHYYDIPDSSVKINLYGSPSIVPSILYEDGTHRLINSSYFVDTVNTHNGKLVLNHNISGVAGNINTIVVHFSVMKYLDENRYNLIGEETFHGNGYTKDGVTTFTLGFSMYKIPILPNRFYKANLSAASGLYGSLFKNDGTFIANLGVSSTGVIGTGEADYMIVNVGANDDVWSELILDVNESEGNTQLYPSVVKKPYTFSGKKGVGFGDSIAAGNVGGSTTANTFIKQFSDVTGMVSTNLASSGTVFTSGLSTATTITDTIKATDLTPYDFVFIAGGTNDYTLGATVTNFRNTIVDLCNWLKLNYSGEVIFITPINRPRTGETPTASLDVFRQTLSEVVLENNYSLIDGREVPIPKEYGSYQQIVIPDGLHPSEKGHTLYSNTLRTVLL